MTGTLTSAEDDDGIRRVRAYTCVDEGKTVTTMGEELRVCTLKQLANKNENGSFVYEDWDSAVAGTYDDQDRNAEVEGYYHAQRIYAMITDPEVGVFEHLPGEHEAGQDLLSLNVVVNYRAPVSPSASALEPCPVAFCLPREDMSVMGDMMGLPGLAGPTVVLGQDEVVDFAYAGDTIYHEFGHIVNHATAGLAHYYADEYGVTNVPWALDEGLANTFAFLTSGRPDLAVFLYTLWTGQQGPAFSGTNTARYPDDWTGYHEVVDGNPILGANWDAYRHLIDHASMTHSGFVRVLLRTLQGLNGIDEPQSFARYAHSFLETLEDEGYGAHVSSVQAGFEARGLFETERAIDLSGHKGGSRDRLAIGSSTDWNPSNVVLVVERDGQPTRMSSAFVQGMLSVPQDATRVVIQTELDESSMPWSEAGDFDLELFVREGSLVRYNIVDGQTTTVERDQVVVPDLVSSGGTTTATFTLEGLTPESTYYVHFVNYGLADGDLLKLEVVFEP